MDKDQFLDEEKNESSDTDKVVSETENHENKENENVISTYIHQLDLTTGAAAARVQRVHLHPLKSSCGCNAPVLRAIVGTMKVGKPKNFYDVTH